MGVTRVTLHGGWQLLQLAGEMSWSALDRPFFFLAQDTLGDFISGTVGSFQSGGAFSGRRALTIECSLMSGWLTCI